MGDHSFLDTIYINATCDRSDVSTHNKLYPTIPATAQNIYDQKRQRSISLFLVADIDNEYSLVISRVLYFRYVTYCRRSDKHGSKYNIIDIVFPLHEKRSREKSYINKYNVIV